LANLATVCAAADEHPLAARLRAAGACAIAIHARVRIARGRVGRVVSAGAVARAAAGARSVGAARRAAIDRRRPVGGVRASSWRHVTAHALAAAIGAAAVAVVAEALRALRAASARSAGGLRRQA